MTHTCHANECKMPVRPDLLMCMRHWCKVPGHLRGPVWADYVKGQEISERQTVAFLVAAADAVEAVAKEEGIDSDNAFRRAYVAAKDAGK